MHSTYRNNYLPLATLVSNLAGLTPPLHHNFNPCCRHGVPMKSIIIIMVAGSVLGNVLYAMAGLMHLAC